jgi:hypothetical protein
MKAKEKETSEEVVVKHVPLRELDGYTDEDMSTLYNDLMVMAGRITDTAYLYRKPILCADGTIFSTIHKCTRVGDKKVDAYYVMSTRYDAKYDSLEFLSVEEHASEKVCKKRIFAQLDLDDDSILDYNETKKVVNTFLDNSGIRKICRGICRGSCCGQCGNPEKCKDSDKTNCSNSLGCNIYLCYQICDILKGVGFENVGKELSAVCSNSSGVNVYIDRTDESFFINKETIKNLLSISYMERIKDKIDYILNVHNFLQTKEEEFLERSKPKKKKTLNKNEK